jgi:hypothetical protein
MTNYEIIQQLEYIRMNVNQKIDMLINSLNVESPSKPSTITFNDSNDTNKKIVNANINRGWTEMTGDQVEMPNMTL